MLDETERVDFRDIRTVMCVCVCVSILSILYLAQICIYLYEVGKEYEEIKKCPRTSLILKVNGNYKTHKLRGKRIGERGA